MFGVFQRGSKWHGGVPPLAKLTGFAWWNDRLNHISFWFSTIHGLGVMFLDLTIAGVVQRLPLAGEPRPVGGLSLTASMPFWHLSGRSPASMYHRIWLLRVYNVMD
jgi:hypothetical protein